MQMLPALHMFFDERSIFIIASKENQVGMWFLTRLRLGRHPRQLHSSVTYVPNTLGGPYAMHPMRTANCCYNMIAVQGGGCTRLI